MRDGRDELAAELENIARALRGLPEQGPWLAHVCFRLLDVAARAASQLHLPRSRFMEQAGQSFSDALRRRDGSN